MFNDFTLLSEQSKTNFVLLGKITRENFDSEIKSLEPKKKKEKRAPVVTSEDKYCFCWY